MDAVQQFDGVWLRLRGAASHRSVLRCDGIDDDGCAGWRRTAGLRDGVMAGGEGRWCVLPRFGGATQQTAHTGRLAAPPRPRIYGGCGGTLAARALHHLSLPGISILMTSR